MVQPSGERRDGARKPRKVAFRAGVRVCSRAMSLPLTRPADARGPLTFETMAFKRLEGFLPGRDLFVILHRSVPPTDADWNLYMEAIKASIAKHPDELANMLNLVLSDGGAPNAMQRTHVTELQESTSARAPISFISDSPLIRGATRAIALFNPRFKVFTPGSFAEAIEHLGVPPSSAAIVKRHVLETEQRFEGGERIRVVRSIFARSGVE